MFLGGRGCRVVQLARRRSALCPNPAPLPPLLWLPGVRAMAWRGFAATRAHPPTVALGSTSGRYSARLSLRGRGGDADTLPPSATAAGRSSCDSRKRQYVTGWQKVQLEGNGGRSRRDLEADVAFGDIAPRCEKGGGRGERLGPTPPLSSQVQFQKAAVYPRTGHAATSETAAALLKKTTLVVTATRVQISRAKAVGV